MPKVALTQALREEYVRLFKSCEVSVLRQDEVERQANRLLAGRARYESVARAVNQALPWYLIGAVHSLESGFDFSRHLHNGDPLRARTVNVPPGRPVAGAPPFSWEESAGDALRLQRLNAWADWSLAGLLYKLEEYNGWGYRLRHPHVLSPYLWSFSSHYRNGKYIADGTWSETAVSRQCGAAVVLRRCAERGEIEVAEAGVAKIMFRPRAAAAPVALMQRFLNTLPNVFVRVDGVAGPRTSQAFRDVTGRPLQGDRRR